MSVKPIRNVTYELTITRTIRYNLKETPLTEDEIKKHFSSMNEVQDFLDDFYGEENFLKNHLKKVKDTSKVYIDFPSDKPYGDSVQVGLTYSFWNRDWSHADNTAWYETDWITIEKIETIKYPISINELLKEANETVKA